MLAQVSVLLLNQVIAHRQVEGCFYKELNLAGLLLDERNHPVVPSLGEGRPVPNLMFRAVAAEL